MENNNHWPKLMYHRNTSKYINFSTLNLKYKIISKSFVGDDLEWCFIKILFTVCGSDVVYYVSFINCLNFAF